MSEKQSIQSKLAKFLHNHVMGCVVTVALLLVCLVLGFLRPSTAALVDHITPEFIDSAGAKYSEAHVNLWVVGVARGRNVKTAETETYIGFAGAVIPADEGLKKTAADIILWLPPLLEGSEITISLTMISVLGGVFLSIFLALGKISKFKLLRGPCSAYIFFFRGTPLLMQLLVVYFGLPMLNERLAINDPFFAACIAFTLNSAAYCAEIIRAAIQSIDKGQFEASHALGLTYTQTMRLIIIPQSIRRLIPPIANEFIMVLKDASLVTMIGLADLTQTTFKISNSNATMTVYFPALVLYLIITALFTFLFNRLEKRFSIHL